MHKTDIAQNVVPKLVRGFTYLLRYRPEAYSVAALLARGKYEPK